MNKRRDRVCGADVHKDLIVATITGDDVLPIRENFGTTKAELKRFRNWLVANKCEQVAFEATGVYWMPIYDALSKTIDTIVANPLQIKTIPNDKSDSKDSNRIATLCLNGQIKRSRVFTDEDRDLRMMTRARSGYVKTRTQFRNRIHKYLSSSGIKLSSTMDDMFCKSGRYILNCLAEEKPIEEILKGIPSGKIRKKQDLIRAALENALNDTNRMLLTDALEFLDNLESKMEKLSLEVLKKVQQKSKDLAIVMSIPGIGFVSASVILSEIGNYRDFQTPDQLAKWCGLNPGENESAGKKKKCGITKRGSKYIRVVLVQAAQTISNMNKTGLSRFFQRLIKKKEHNVVIVAVARKLICLIYHLLINQELYQEDDGRKKRSSQDKSCQAPSFQEEHLTDRVAAIVDAFYHLKESSRKNALMREIADISGIKVGHKRPSKGGG
ncbi:MAG: IS110 family RNA-guided transposase [Methanothrix sp.]